MSHLRHGGVGRDAGAADEEGDAEVVFVDLHLMGGEAKLPTYKSKKLDETEIRNKIIDTIKTRIRLAGNIKLTLTGSSRDRN